MGRGIAWVVQNLGQLKGVWVEPCFFVLQEIGESHSLRLKVDQRVLEK